MSVADSGVSAVAETFELVFYNKKKPVQLVMQVGTQGLQLFDATGQKLIHSFHYFQMSEWLYLFPAAAS